MDCPRSPWADTDGLPTSGADVDSSITIEAGRRLCRVSWEGENVRLLWGVVVELAHFLSETKCLKSSCSIAEELRTLWAEGPCFYLILVEIKHMGPA